MAPSARASGDLAIAVGKLTRTHGVRGECRLVPYFEDALFALRGKSVTLTPQGRPAHQRKLLELRPGPKSLLARFEGIDSPEAAQPILPAVVTAPKRLLPPLPKGEYYYEEIIGLPAYDEAGRALGRLTEFFEAGEKDVWTFTGDGGQELMLPCLPETILSVDLEAERIVVRPMETVE
ncbi:MAG: 16S rRNA processing protein RimM [Nitrospinae bacterium]|nr:16S rRNA processing protein RimM [Nitrospinota bacterium]